MEELLPYIQVIVALGLLNVWLIRPKKATAYRGGTAKTMREEFAAYGLPYWFMILVGILKVAIAVLLIAGLWIPYVALFSAAVLAVLMSGAVLMHIKVKDPLKKTMPALTMLILSALIVLLS